MRLAMGSSHSVYLLMALNLAVVLLDLPRLLDYTKRAVEEIPGLRALRCASKAAARVAEQLCNGLQIRGPGCKSRPVLHFLTTCAALLPLPMFHQSKLSHSLSQKWYSCHYGNRERGIASNQEY